MMRIKDRILEYVRALEYDVSPNEIALKLKINSNSTYSALSRLVKTGNLVKTSRGLYCTNPAYGVGGATKPIRIQNLTVVCDKTVKESKRVLIEYPDIAGETFRIRLILGKKRNKISWTVSAALGLDRYGFLLARSLIETHLELLGYSKPFNWVAKNYELLQDFIGVKMDGVKALTLDDLDGTLQKIYEKSYGTRKESRSNKPAQLEDLLSLTLGGLPTFQLMQGVGVTNQSIKDLTQSLNRFAGRQYDLERIVMALVTANQRLNDILYKNLPTRPKS